MSHSLSHSIEGITGLKRNTARIATVLGAGAPSAPSAAMVPAGKPSSMTEFLREIRATAPTDVKDGIGTVVGAVAGGVLWKKHRVLGVIGGASLGRNLPALMDPAQRKQALGNLGITSAAVLGSFTVPKHPVIGFVLGLLAGGAATYYGGLR